MKRFTKICLLCSGVLLVLGLVSLAAGVALGARPQDFKKYFPKKHTVIYWNDEMAGPWDDAEDDYDHTTEDYMEEDWEDHHLDLKKEHHTGWSVNEFEETYGDSNTRKLELDLNKSVVAIRTYDGDAILVKGSNAGGYFEVTERGDALCLSDHRGSRRDKLALEIYLPKRSLDSIELELGAVKLEADTLDAAKVELSLGAGEVSIGSILAEETDLEIGAGSCQIDSLSSSRQADLEVGAGELLIKSFQGGSADLDCGMGRLAMAAQGRQTDYNYEISCGIGNVQVGGSSYAGLSREKTIRNGSDKTISMDCGVGEIELSFQE